MEAALRPRARRPVFVVGYMHSGTTLLLRLLGANGGVFPSAGETKYFEFLPLLARTYPDLSAPDVRRRLVLCIIDLILNGDLLRFARNGDPREDLVDAACLESILRETAEARGYGALFGAVFDRLAGRAGRIRWLEKTPTHVFHLEAIRREIPDALFVEIVRDPRDVLASKKTRRATVWTTGRYTAEQRGFKHLEKAYDPFWDTLSWKATIRAGRAGRSAAPDDFFSVRYEDLVARPEATTRDLCAFLEMPFEPEMLEVPHGNSAEVSGDPGEAGVRTDSTGRWKRVLSPGEVALCQRLAAAELRDLGYTPAAVSPAARVAATPLLLAASFEFGLRFARRWRMGGARFAMSVLANYWKRAQRLVRG